jgi:transcription initiation factor TFIID subunit 4
LQRWLVVVVGVVQDESLHSGADVEAFTAALNREVEASANSSSTSAASSSQPTDHGAGKP